MTNHCLNLTELISTYNIGNEGKKQCSESDQLAAVEIIFFPNSYILMGSCNINRFYLLTKIATPYLLQTKLVIS